MSEEIQALIIGSGPVASLVAACINHEKYPTAWLCFPERIEDLKTNGLELTNHPDRVVPLMPSSYRGFKKFSPREIGFDLQGLSESGLNVFSTPLPPDSVPVSDSPVIFLTAKSYDNIRMIEQVRPLLERSKSPVIVSVQNGIAPESKISAFLQDEGIKADVVRGVPMGPCTFTAPGKLLNGIFRIDIGHWDADLLDMSRFAEVRARVAGLFDSLYLEPKDDFKTISASKALANLINSNAVIFASDCGEAVTSRFMHELYQAKANEGIMVFRALGADIRSLPSLDAAYFMFDTTRGHIPSMGRDPFVVYQGGKDYPFDLRTEIVDIDTQVAEFGRESRIVTFWNSFCAFLVEDFCRSFNEIRKSSGHDRAVEFGLRFAARNRHTAGLEPYIFAREYGIEFPVLIEKEREVRAKFGDMDTNLDSSSGMPLMEQAVYLCGHLAHPGSRLGSLPHLVIKNYRDLKNHYKEWIADPSYNPPEETCTRKTHCTTPCYSLFNRA